MAYLEGLTKFSPINQARATVAAKKAMMPVLKVAPPKPIQPGMKPAPVKKPVAIKPVPLPKPIAAPAGGGGGMFGGLATALSDITAPDKLPFLIGAAVVAFLMFRRR